MSKLWEISEEMERLFLQVDPDTGEVDEETSAQIDALGVKKEEKIFSTASYIKGLRLEATGIEAQADELDRQADVVRARAQRLINQAEKWERYIGRHLSKGEKYQNDQHKVFTRESTAVVVEDEKAIPDGFWRWPEPPLPKPDKKAINRWLDKGKDVPGARLEKRRKVVVE